MVIIISISIAHCNNSFEQGGRKQATPLEAAPIEEVEAECPPNTERVGGQCQPLCEEGQHKSNGVCVDSCDYDVDCEKYPDCNICRSAEAEREKLKSESHTNN